MDHAAKRTLVELVARYKNEPTLQDIYVEGDSDAALVDWFLRDQGLRDVAVYPSDSVFVHPSDLVRMHLPDGNRGRTIAIARVLAENVPTARKQILCIVDRDWDLVLGATESNPCLAYTDFCSMEMYVFDIGPLNKFFSLVVRRPDINAAGVLHGASPALREMFLIRASAHSLRWGLRWDDPFKFCTLTGTTVTLDRRRLLTAYLATRGRVADMQEMLDRIELLRARCDLSPRHTIRGHDFVDFLAWFLPKAGCSRTVFNLQMVERSLLGCIDLDALRGYPLFQRITRQAVRPPTAP